jgi:hypothetical protein
METEDKRSRNTIVIRYTLAFSCHICTAQITTNFESYASDSPFRPSPSPFYDPSNHVLPCPVSFVIGTGD